MKQEEAERNRADSMMDECIAYFKAHSVYEKLFSGFRSKYESLGHFGGTVILSGLSQEETEDLFGFLNTDYGGRKKISISAKQMEKALAGSRFSQWTWEEILTAYFGEPLSVRKEVRQKAEEQKQNWFQGVYQEVRSRWKPDISDWFLHLYRDKTEGYPLVLQRYQEEVSGNSSCTRLKENLFTIFQSMEQLPLAEPELFNVFAARMTGNPHYFDSGSDGERLIFAYLRYQENKPSGLSDAAEEKVKISVETGEESELERKTRLFYQAGLLRDEFSNDVLVYGIHGILPDGKIHMGIEGFWQEKEPMRLTLHTVGKLKMAVPVGMETALVGASENPVWETSKKVYVVENPAVFSHLIKNFPDITVICGNGQIRLAAMYLMDRFPESVSFYYAGDFDPEGLQIAQRLKRRYKDRFHFWNYDVSFYHENLSDVLLSEPRLKKLETVTLEELQPLCAAMRKRKKAAYQECMMEQYAAAVKDEEPGGREK